MREFGVDYLFRISLVPADVWSKHYGKKVKPIYVVASDKTTAESYARSNLVKDVKISSITRIAKYLAGNIFTGNIKKIPQVYKKKTYQ